MNATYHRRLKSGPAMGATIGVVYGPNLSYRGKADTRYGTGVCRHEHETDTAAERCARVLARRIFEAEATR